MKSISFKSVTFKNVAKLIIQHENENPEEEMIELLMEDNKCGNGALCAITSCQSSTCTDLVQSGKDSHSSVAPFIHSKFLHGISFCFITFLCSIINFY